MGGIYILAVFAAVWGAAGVVLAGATLAWIVLPVGMSAALLLAARRLAPGVPRRSEAEESRVGRLVGIWSAAEGVAMFLAANGLINLHHPEWVPAAFAGIVGLHFLPLARGLPVPAYYATGAALILIAAAGMLAAPIVTQPLVCFGAALVLWTTIAVLLSRIRAGAPR
jgi:hypothetical protein